MNYSRENNYSRGNMPLYSSRTESITSRGPSFCPHPQNFAKQRNYGGNASFPWTQYAPYHDELPFRHQSMGSYAFVPHVDAHPFQHQPMGPHETSVSGHTHLGQDYEQQSIVPGVAFDNCPTCCTQRFSLVRHIDQQLSPNDFDDLEDNILAAFNSGELHPNLAPWLRIALGIEATPHHLYTLENGNKLTQLYLWILLSYANPHKVWNKFANFVLSDMVGPARNTAARLVEGTPEEEWVLEQRLLFITGMLRDNLEFDKFAGEGPRRISVFNQWYDHPAVYVLPQDLLGEVDEASSLLQLKKRGSETEKILNAVFDSRNRREQHRALDEESAAQERRVERSAIHVGFHSQEHRAEWVRRAADAGVMMPTREQREKIDRAQERTDQARCGFPGPSHPENRESLMEECDCPIPIGRQARDQAAREAVEASIKVHNDLQVHTSGTSKPTPEDTNVVSAQFTVDSEDPAVLATLLEQVAVLQEKLQMVLERDGEKPEVSFSVDVREVEDGESEDGIGDPEGDMADIEDVGEQTRSYTANTGSQSTQTLRGSTHTWSKARRGRGIAMVRDLEPGRERKLT